MFRYTNMPSAATAAWTSATAKKLTPRGLMLHKSYPRYLKWIAASSAAAPAGYSRVPASISSSSQRAMYSLSKLISAASLRTTASRAAAHSSS